MGAPENYSVSQNSYNGFNLPKISHVARSNSLRCSSPPRHREPNIPTAVQEESQQFQSQPYPLVHQVDNSTRKNSQTNNNSIPIISTTNNTMIFNVKPNETNKPGTVFGNHQASINQPPAPLGPLQLQQHHFQQHLQQQQMIQQQKQLDHSSTAGLRHHQDLANNNPQRGSVTSSIHSTGLQSTAVTNGTKQEQRLTHEQFRAALQMVVSNGDPRDNLENFIKIGEGSTGTVWIAMEKSTSKLKLHFTKHYLGSQYLFYFRAQSGGQKNGSTKTTTT